MYTEVICYPEVNLVAIITKEKLTHLADQSRFYLTDDERDIYLKELNDTFTFSDKINELDTENVTPTSNGNQNTNVWREDHPVQWEQRDAALDHAPDHDGAHFKVP